PPLSHDALANLLTAVVRHFGVDPAWLVTGRYDVWSHAVAEELSADHGAIRGQVERLLAAAPSDRPVEIERVGGADRGAAPVTGNGGPVQGRSGRQSWRNIANTSDPGPDDAVDERRS
ncbi:MAG: hypothetical protein M3282_02205, partial [Gemmatimonadota bacterium]|nr:hypothetical protein [Gemmatimonadota bacterium]